MKTTLSRTDLLELLTRVRERCPEMRFGQLLATIGLLAEDETGHSLWEVDDIEFEAALQRFGSDMARRAEARSEPAAIPDVLSVDANAAPQGADAGIVLEAPSESRR